MDSKGVILEIEGVEASLRDKIAKIRGSLK